MGLCSQAQLSGTKTIPGDYPNLATAVTDLNTQGVGGGGVTFELAAGYTESSADSIMLTATGTSANPIVFRKAAGGGANPLITRTGAGLLATTSLSAAGDAVIIIEGSDFVTFDGIDVATNNQGIEYGYLVRKASATDGAKNVVIQNATITLTKGTSAYVIGILVHNHVRGGSVSAVGGVTVTSTGGRHENITIRGNRISNVFTGVYLRGFNHTTAPNDFYDQNIVVGSAGAGNNITNYAGNAASASYGVYAIYVNNVSADHNVVDNTANGGSGFTSTGYGIYFSTGTGASFTANNNTVTVSSASTSATYGIYNSAYGGAGSMNDNTVSLTASVASTGSYAHLYNGNTTTALTINNNTIVGTTLQTTGTTYFIYNNNSSAATMSVRNNQVSGNFNRSGTSGTLYGYYNNGSPTGVEEFADNNFSNITLAGTSIFYGANSTTATANTQNYFNNTISNVGGGTGTVYGFNLTTAGTRNVYDNVIHTLSGGTVYGILSGSGFTAGAIYKNKIYGLTSNSTGTGTVVYGISASSGAPTIYNNLVGDLNAPTAAGTDAIRGISITSTSTTSTSRVYYNTVYLNATSSGTNFGTSALYASTSTTATSGTLDLRNNILVNTSTPAGTGVTAAFRRSSTTLSNFGSTSNNNLFYAGAPSANRVIFYDGTNADQTIATYQARVAPAETASISEMPTFVSTTGADATYLHISTSAPTRIEGGGQPIAGFTDDFDGDTRDANTPDIGADEFAGTQPSGCSGTPTAGTITGPATVCVGSGRTLQLSGQSTDVGITYEWQFSDVQGGPYTPIAGATGSSLATGNLTATRYYIAVVRCTNSGQQVETPEFTLTATALPVVTVSPAAPSVCAGSSVSLTASGADTYAWTPATNLTPTTGATVTATPTITRTYTVTGTETATGCVGTATVTVAVNPALALTATATPATICSGASSQLLASVGNSVRTYSVASIPSAPVAATGTPTVLANNGTAVVAVTAGDLEDGRWENIALPFTFNFYGTDYSSINISTNGYATFGTVTTSTGFAPVLPSTSTPNNAVHFLSADLDFRSPATGRLEYFTEGTAPNRKFVINMVNAAFYDVTTGNNPGTASVQAIFYEGSNDIEVHTIALSNTSVIKTQGIESATGTFATVVPGRNAAATWNGVPDAVRFSLGTLNYSWTPATFLSSTTIANPVASNVTATTTYTVTATEALTGCSATATVTLTAGDPLTVNSTASSTSICFGSSATLNAAPVGGGQPYTYSWSNGTNVVGTTQSVSVSPSANTTYTVTVTDACGNTATSTQTVTVNNPTVTGTTPATRCGQGTVTLQATSGAGTTLSWYAAATGGQPIGTGSSFTTPAISSTTTFYVGASQPGDNVNAGRLAPAGGTGTNLTTYGQDFTVTKTITLNSVDVVSITGTSITISLYSAGGATQLQTTGARTVPTNTTSVITLGWTIAPGTYRLVANGMTGNFIRENSGVTYPIALSTAGQINGFVSAITGAVTTTASYYFMYNWNIQVPCEGQRTAVLATVTTPPSISVTASSSTICRGQETTLSVTSPNAGYTYTWMPGNLTGASITVTPQSASNKYYVTAVDNSGGANNSCATSDSITITVNPAVQASATSASATVCAGGSTQLTGVALVQPPVRITEIMLNRGGTGSTNPYPAYLPTATPDVVEISNVSNSPADVSGLTFQVWTTTVVNRTYTFPAGTIIPAQGIALVHVGAGTNDPANLFFNTGGANDNLLSTTAAGFVLRTSNGIVDAVATNSYVFTAASGVTTNDWSGNIPSTSGLAGPIRSAATDNNVAADWTLSSASNLQTLGALNTAFQPIALPTLTYQWIPAAGLSDANIANPVATPTVTTDYILIATNTTTGCQGRDTVTVTVTPNTLLTTVPQAQTVCAGANATFTAAATGAALTYVWKKDDVLIPGATSATYTVNAAAAADAGTYEVIVTGTCGMDSVSATLTVNAITAITTQPVPRAACANGSATFGVTAVGANLSYQWLLNGNPITGATGATYTVTNASTANVGNYSVQVNGACGNVTSAEVAFILTANTIITQQPASQALCPGAAATFTVVATGSNLTYQWKKDGTDIAGANAATYSIASVSATDAGSYTVVVSGACGDLVSNPAVLSLNAANSWTGAVSSNWNNAGNWCGGIPTNTTNVTIPAGSANMPIVNTTVAVGNLTIASGASLIVDNGGTLELYGNLVNNGSFNASSGTIAFRGATAQTSPGIAANRIIMNGAGGVTITGNGINVFDLTLTQGNITVNNQDVRIENVVTGGSVNSHIVLLGTSRVLLTNVGNVARTAPIGIDATSYNPVTIANGFGRDFIITLAAGINPAAAWPANAVNRTWTITPSAANANPATVTFGFADTDGGSAFNGSANMEVGSHNGTAWTIVTPAGGVAPAGTAAARTVTTTTTTFGAMAVGNVGSLLLITSTPRLDADVTLVQLLPNVVVNNTVLRVSVRRTLQTQWVLTDAQGRVVRSFKQSLTAGTNDLRLSLGDLSAGTYFLQGSTGKGNIGTLRLVKQ
ncbi:hypothetical protein GCM10023184_23630 [Flaviaesturariibacter amylovorans]|uniref:T9SS type A sorting domain-containing protein n=2 Tax=Flaviaesturariibacter amylovorans TaxID=1084520 RepID=A0ABP8GY32_9BACT